MDGIPFVFSNDDPGMEEPELFAELLDFLAEQQVPATFFVIPNAGNIPLDHKSKWLSLLERALAEGHDLQLHGYVHGPFEFGLPPGFMLDIMPESKARLHDDPEPILAEHTYEVLHSKLERGLEIFQRALSVTPSGFRSGCLATCDHMYQALGDLGFQWSSNCVVNPMGWRYINCDYDAGEPWQPDVPPRPFEHESGVQEIPLLSEYTWYLEEQDIERHFQLAKSDLERTHAASGAYVTLSHYYAMTGKWSAGLRLYERLFAHARKMGNVRFTTLRDLAAEHGT